VGAPGKDPLVLVVLINDVPLGKARSGRALADRLAALTAAYARAQGS
jgi:hypothetical protein